MATDHGDQPERAGREVQVSAADLELLIEALVRDGVDDLDRPHVVITQDARTGCVMLQGPYPHAIDALRIAERDARWLDGDEESVVLRVAPLLPPTICWE